MAKSSHPQIGHGFVQLAFESAKDAGSAQGKLFAGLDKDRRPTGKGAPAGVKITSIDHLEDKSAAANKLAKRSGKRPPGKALLLEVTTNHPDPIGSDTAHQKLLAVSQWARGLCQAPGLEGVTHTCCYGDQ